jgi:hypothetical protein|tara:strand:+ start:9257 stop:9436 length:180 start_codon:yes stop_codon:yes gene_type:complete
MPEKFKKSQTVRDKASGKIKTQHFYIKNTSLSELQEYLEKSSAQPKIIQKVKRELYRRG